MEHEAVIEAIELAALEPGGLDRLMAGDTATSQAVAAHLAGCPSCVAELAAIDRDSRVIADVVATTPPADLRARTLELVRERGVPRGVVAPATDASVLSTEPSPATGAARRRTTLGWVAAIAATVLLSVGATSVFVADRSQDELAVQAKTVESLERVIRATMTVAAEPDAARVELVGTGDPETSGSLLFSPSSTELVVTASGLVEPPAGMEFGCWIDTGAGRTRIGKMYFGGGLAYWAGASEAVAGLDGPATFGVSLVEVGSPTMDAEPVLLGRS